MIRQFGPPGPEKKLVLEEDHDPVRAAEHKTRRKRYVRNSDWLTAHWPDLLPAARGRHVAVAAQEAFVADTPEEAWAMARAAHPEDDGALLQYVPKEEGPRIYANRG